MSLKYFWNEYMISTFHREILQNPHNCIFKWALLFLTFRRRRRATSNNAKVNLWICAQQLRRGSKRAAASL